MVVSLPGSCGVDLNGPTTALELSAKAPTLLVSSRVWLVRSLADPEISSAGIVPGPYSDTPASGPSETTMRRSSGGASPGGGADGSANGATTISGFCVP